MMSETTNSTAV